MWLLINTILLELHLVGLLYIKDRLTRQYGIHLDMTIVAQLVTKFEDLRAPEIHYLAHMYTSLVHTLTYITIQNFKTER